MGLFEKILTIIVVLLVSFAYFGLFYLFFIFIEIAGKGKKINDGLLTNTKNN